MPLTGSTDQEAAPAPVVVEGEAEPAAPGSHTLDLDGNQLAYEVRGAGPHTIVLLHGLLLPRHVNGAVADLLVDEGYRVVLLDLLGHGASDKPTHASAHRLEYAGRQVLALLDHMDAGPVVLGGMSLGANVTLEVACRAPDRLQGLICEMPVLERGTIGALIQLAPLLLLLRYASRPVGWLFRAVGRLPRTSNEALNAVLDTAGDPRAMAAIMHGYASGPVCPPLEERQQIDLPTLVIGHRRDRIHPMDDATALAAEVPNARFVQARHLLELRTAPTRIVDEIVRFLADAWAAPDPSVHPSTGADEATT